MNWMRRMRGQLIWHVPTNWPNDTGNYTGKRKAQAMPAPLTPRERFLNLAAAYEAKARDYRWKRTGAAA